MDSESLRTPGGKLTFFAALDARGLNAIGRPFDVL
jgi:hypothetical protein